MKLDTRKIRVLMAQRDILSQRELADRIGITYNAMSGLMRGKRTPTLETVGRLCEALGCTPNDILILDEEESRGEGVALAAA